MAITTGEKMKFKDRTKWIFAETLIEMAKEKSVEKIQVKELCERCRAERTTFYYHFRDKYDLIAWIFMQMYETEEKQAQIINGEEMLVRMFRRIWEQRAFFRNAFQDKSQNSLSEYQLEFYIRMEREVLCRYLGVEELDEETEYTIKQYSYGCLGNTIEWILGKNDLTPEKMGYYQYRLMPDILKQAWAVR